MKNLFLRSLLSSFTLLSSLCNLATSSTSSPTPSAATADTCKALQKATAVTGMQCSTNQDCTIVTCHLRPLSSLSASITLSFEFKKCHKPVEVIMSINVPIAQYKYSYTFEGSQTVPIPSVPSYIAIFVGQPYVHVQIEGEPGGVNMSAGVWLKNLVSSKYTRYSLFREQFIPLDVSTCPSTVTATLPSKWADFHDYSDDYESDTIADVLKKWLGLLNILPTKGSGVVTSRVETGGPVRPTLPTEPVLGALPTDIIQLMKLSPAFKKCVDDASKKYFGVGFDQLQLVQKGIIPTGFKVPHDSDDGVAQFTQAAVVCGINHAVAGSFSLTEMPSVSLDGMLVKLAKSPKIKDCANEVLKTYGIDADMIPSMDPMKTLNIERDLLQCFYGPTKSNKDNGEGGESTTWIIVGAIGDLAFTAIVIYVIVVCVKRRRRASAASGTSYRRLGTPSEPTQSC